MKNIALIIGLYLLCYNLLGQPTGPFPYPTAPVVGANIVTMEYFFDEDLPAFGMSTSLTGFTSSTNIAGFTSSLTLPSGITAGFHKVYIRTKDALGRWSQTANVYFDNFTPPAYPNASAASGNIIAMEYYFDNDLPNFGTAIPLAGFTANTNVSSFSSNLNLPAGFSAGFHKVYIRSKDISGKWSQTQNVYFDNYIPPTYPTASTANGNIVAMEYFFDLENPAPGTATPLTDFTASTNVANLNFNIALPAVFPGKFHRLYIRSKDITNKWSQTNSAYFDNYTVPAYTLAPHIAPQIGKIEYFFDTDPGAGNGFTATMLPANTGNIVGFNFDASIGTLMPGDHKIFIRSRQNPFSLSSTATFNKTAPALPINLISFTGKPTENGNELNWQTASEVNNAYFEIERAESKSLKFHKIGHIIGANNSAEKQFYTYLDENTSEENLYRLKQIDFDGKFAYSKIIAVKNYYKAEFGIYPNPLINQIEISNKSGEEILIELFDMQGRAVSKAISMNGNIIKIPANHLLKGNYLVKIKNSKGNYLRKIVKE